MDIWETSIVGGISILVTRSVRSILCEIGEKQGNMYCIFLYVKEKLGFSHYRYNAEYLWYHRLKANSLHPERIYHLLIDKQLQNAQVIH